jgi:hypothetical protein
MSKLRVLNTAGSLSEADMSLLVGTGIIEEMVRNRLLIINEEVGKEFDWIELTNNIQGLYHIRSIDKTRLYQVWFEYARDMEIFQQNLMVTKLSS